jgi:cellulose synthase/poly-beta-1,6-N-acetylglucosamine synthase-like glycosyltransferase
VKRLVGSLIGLYALLSLSRGIWRGLRAAANSSGSSSSQPEHWPFVSIIVPAWRDSAALKTCLLSLREVDYPSYEVIVVAGGPDGTYETACAAARHDHRIQVVEQLPRGKNAALNQGIALASAAILVFLDADSELTPPWLKALVAALRDGVAASTGNYKPLNETPVSLYGDLAKVHEYQVRNRVILQGSGGIALRREALEAIGPFPEERVSSDWDLDARLALHGYRKVFVPDAVIRSHRPATVRDWWRNELRWRRLHLRSLSRLRASLLAHPVPMARHLYPYIASWTAFVLTAVGVASLLLKPGRLKETLVQAGAAFFAFSLVREAIPVVSVMSYQPSARWLAAALVTPLLTVMTWAACVVASVSRDRVVLQFKGARLAARERK